MHKNIILTGFMGTGKSTIGLRLAKELGYQFVDTDQLIEKRVGKSIAELFQDEGEKLFRQLECDVSRELATQSRLVIATGGGLLTNPENITALAKTGQIICLTASPEDILERISRQPGSRPLLDEPNPRQKIIELLKQRAPVYDQFPQISTSNGNHQSSVKKILQLIEQ